MLNGDFAYLSATELLQKLDASDCSSVELLDMYLQQIRQQNPALNAVICLDEEAARLRAQQADEARARGESWGALHGLPLTVKDTYEVVGMPCTAGSLRLKTHLPKRNAVAVQRLIDAGAIVFGKTNVPEFATDLQSYNKVYGTTNNPWDLSRTPGGSSGGAAAAVAAGLTAVELGSDIGGSIRTPAHYCGVFGHKSTHGIISLRGHIPGPPGTLSDPDLAVAGPIARSTDDLALMLSVLAGSSIESSAWQLHLPAPKRERIADLRVLVWLDDPLCVIDHGMRAGFAEFADALRESGAHVDSGAPLGLPLERFYGLYLNLLASVLGSSYGQRERSLMYWASNLYEKVSSPLRLPKHFENFFKGVGQTHAEWLRNNEIRQKLKAKVLPIFDEYDVIVAPVVPMPAIKHQQQPEMPLRKIKVNGETRSYTEHLTWISFATLLGLPATTLPVARSREGLPYGLQVIGAPYADLSTIRYAGLMAEVTGGYKRPPVQA